MSYEDINEFGRKLPEVLSKVGTASTRKAKPNKVRMCIRWRAARSELLGHNLFYDPAWDIMLCLYASHLEGVETGLEELKQWIDVPATVLCRWLTVLEERRLISRNKSRSGADESISLTDTGLGGMHALYEVLTKEPLG